MSPALGLTAYRVVQESITNVLKHAGPRAAARVTVACTPQTIEIEVTDDGRGAAADDATDSPVVGHGLRGMGERVALLHGTWTPGRDPAAGSPSGSRSRWTAPARHPTGARRSGS